MRKVSGGVKGSQGILSVSMDGAQPLLEKETNQSITKTDTMDVHTMIVVYVPVGGKVNCTVGIRWRRIHRDANPHVHSPVKRIRVEGCGRRSVHCSLLERETLLH